MNAAKFKVSAIKKWAVISKEGKYNLEVNSSTIWNDGEYDKCIMNFRALRGDMLDELIPKLQKAGNDGFIDASELNDYTFNGSVIVNNINDFAAPIKGEKVTAMIKLLDDEEGKYKHELYVTNININKASETKSLSDLIEESKADEMIAEETDTPVIAKTPVKAEAETVESPII